MVSKYDLKKYIKENEEKLGFKYNESDDSIYNKAGERISSLDEFVHYYRLKTGEAFTCIYNCPGTLLNVLRCDKCGTVIFSSDDYQYYDDNLKCPTCTDYQTNFTYWTKSEIEKDSSKAGTIKMYEEFAEERHQIYIRREKTGKYNSEVLKKTFRIKSKRIDFILGCDNYIRSPFKGLRFEIKIWNKDSEDSLFCTLKKHINIPLSWSQIYIRFIYRHLGKCHPDLRSKWYIGKPIEEKSK